MKKRLKGMPVSFYVGAVILFVILLMTFFPGLFTDQDPYTQDMNALLQGPSAAHWFGTDDLGRDVYARVIYGTRIDLAIGIFAMLVPAVTGTLIGLCAGYYGKKVDAVLMRILDVITAFPFIILVIAIVAIIGSGIRNMFIAIWCVGWKDYAKLVRSEVLAEKNMEYVAAAKTLGFSGARIMLRHILPNVIDGAFVYAISDVMMCMMVGASLSFLGLGVSAPTPEWGAIITGGRPFLTSAWWISIFPGIFLAVAGVAISFVGKGVAEKVKAK